MEVIVCNASHPEDESVSIRFPIPRQKYDDVILQLGRLGFGDALEQDCCVQEIISEYSVLESLKQSCVNLDELNYLAKRLDSFRGYEAVQFEAAASAEGITSIQGFINLTFCCPRITVVEDFKDFERIGKNHVMARNNGIVSKEEWENCNFQQEALYLLLKEEGIITPYGVVYENGMELKRLYQGKSFPEYQNGEVMAVTVEDNTGTAHTLFLPMADAQIERELLRAGIESTASLSIVETECFLPMDIEGYLDFRRGDIFSLNRLCESLEDFLPDMLEKLPLYCSTPEPEIEQPIMQPHL